MPSILLHTFLILVTRLSTPTSCSEPKLINHRKGRLDDVKYIIYHSSSPLDHNIQRDHFTELRDFYRTSEKWSVQDWELSRYPQVITLSLLSTYFNISLLLAPEAMQLNLQNQPEIQRVSSSEFWGPIRTIDNRTFNLSESIPAGVGLIEVITTESLFVYCDISKSDKMSIWNFWIFLDPSDKKSWCLFFASFLMVIPLSGKISRVIMPILSATLSIGTQAPVPKSKIFLIWMGSCMLLTSFYSAEITGDLTVPPEDDLMTHFHHLKERDYTMVFPKPLEGILTSINLYLNRSPSPIGKVVKWLLAKGVVNVEHGKVFNFLVCDPRKLVAIGPWPLMLSIGWLDTKEDCAEASKRTCHISEEMEKAGEDFYVFLPPQNSKFVDGLMHLLEAGIHQRWIQEENGLLHSMRVQDRVRVKSPFNVVEKKDNEAPPQKLKGKMFTLFLLWGVGLVLSLISFFFEVSLLSVIRDAR